MGGADYKGGRKRRSVAKEHGRKRGLVYLTNCAL